MTNQDTLLRNFEYLTIPATIWLRRDISMQAKTLWAEIRSLYNINRGGCYASEEYLCEFMQLKRRRFYDVLKELKNAGLLEVVSFDGRHTVRKALLPNEEKSHSSSAENCTPQVQEDALPSYIEKKDEKKDDVGERRRSLATALSNPEPPPQVEDLSLSDIVAKLDLVATLSLDAKALEFLNKPEYSLEDVTRAVEFMKYAPPSKNVSAQFTAALKGRWPPAYPQDLLDKNNQIIKDEELEAMKIYENDIVKNQIYDFALKCKDNFKDGYRLIACPDPKNAGTDFESVKFFYLISQEAPPRKIPWTTEGLRYLQRVAETYKKELVKKPLNHFRGAKD